MWAMIREICESIIMGYPTDLDQDQEMLDQKSDLSWNIQNLIQLRMSEKKVLIYMHRAAMLFLEMLNLPKQEAIAKFKACPDTSNMDDYYEMITKKLLK